MIIKNKYNILGLIPARSGSKGIHRKNIKSFSGKPLLCWTINEAKKSKYLNSVVVSTDDNEIATLAQKHGAEIPFMRPEELSTDSATSIDTVLHAINELPEVNWILLLQPTSPLRTVEDIDGIIEFCIKNQKSSAVSICEANSHPFWTYQRSENYQLSSFISQSPNITNRQQLPIAYTVNGALYLAKTEWLRKSKSFITSDTIGYVMPTNRSNDIDTEEDWDFAEYIMQKRLGAI